MFAVLPLGEVVVLDPHRKLRDYSARAMNNRPALLPTMYETGNGLLQTDCRAKCLCQDDSADRARIGAKEPRRPGNVYSEIKTRSRFSGSATGIPLTFVRADLGGIPANVIAFQEILNV